MKANRIENKFREAKYLVKNMSKEDPKKISSNDSGRYLSIVREKNQVNLKNQASDKLPNASMSDIDVYKPQFQIKNI